MNRIISFAKQLSLDRKLFFALVFLIPLQKRHIFFQPQSYIAGAFNEWTSIFLYVTDIVFIVLMIAWVVALIREKYWKQARRESLYGIIFLIIGWAIVSVATAPLNGYLWQSLFHAAKMGEYLLLVLYIDNRLQARKLITATLHVFIFSATIQSLISVAQFIYQKSIGLKFFGEIDLAPQITNIAKIIIRDKPREILIRPTALFPHANVLGGFLAIALISGIGLLVTEFATSQYQQARNKKNNSIVNILLIECTIIAVALTYSFSRTAWLAAIVGIAALIASISHWAPYLAAQTFHAIRTSLPAKFMLLSFAIFIILTLPLLTNRTLQSHAGDDYATAGRVLYTKLAFTMIAHSPITGTGPANFTPMLQRVSPDQLAAWQFQPVHNGALLIATEYGIIGAGLYAILLYLIVKKYLIAFFVLRSKQKNVRAHSGEYFFTIYCAIGASLIACGIISLTDHYLITIQQSALMLALILGLALTLGRFGKIAESDAQAKSNLH